MTKTFGFSVYQDIWMSAYVCICGACKSFSFLDLQKQHQLMSKSVKIV